MTYPTLTVAPGPQDRSVRTAEGEILQVPADWELLPPGDAGVTRRVKSRGPHWVVKEKRGRRTFSRGVWAPADRIATVKAEFAAERSTDAYAKKMASAAQRRERQQADYVNDFKSAILSYLDFDDQYSSLADRLAEVVSKHATPVGSGTVARTKRISIEDRAAAAVIAWLRHRTTAYDQMRIPRGRGMRREVRRKLAARSQQLLESYRQGRQIDLQRCPLAIALADDA